MGRTITALLTSVTLAFAVAPAHGQQASPGGKAGLWLLDTTTILVENGCTDALPKLEAVLSKSPQDHAAWRQLGYCYGEAKAPEKRLAAYNEAWKLRPRDVEDAYRVAWSLEDMKRWQEAFDVYNAALTIDPAHAKSILGKGVTLYHLKRNAEALPQLNEALRRMPDDSRVLLHRAMVLHELDRLDEAMADLYRVIRTQPDQASRAYFVMMGIFEWRKMAAETLAATKIFLRYEPDNQSVLRDLPRKERNAQLQAAQGRVPTHMPLTPEQVARGAPPPAAVPGTATAAPSPSPPAARAQGHATLAVGPDAGGYACPDGRQIWVSRCYDQSAQASCQVVHLHQKNNGLNPETAATRAELLVSLKDCTLTPLEFGPRGVGLAGAKAAQSVPAAPATRTAPTTDEDALWDQWLAAYNRGDYDGAIDLLRGYIRKAPNETGTYIFLSMTHVAKGDIDGAEQALLQARAVAPANASVHAELGSLYLKHRHDEQRALVELRTVLQIPSASMQDLVIAGELLDQAGDGTNATEAFRRAVQMSGDPRLLARAWVGFGKAQSAAARYPQALVALNEAIRLNPKNADAHEALAALHYKQGDHARELGERQAVVQLKPRDAWAQWLLGRAHTAMKQSVPALAAYDKAADLAMADGSMKYHDLLGQLGTSYEDLGQWARAVAVYKAQLVAQPKDAEQATYKAMTDMLSCNDLGRALARQKQYPEVVRLYIARGACSEHVAEGSLGTAYAWLGQPAEAIEYLESATIADAESIANWERDLADGKLDAQTRDVRHELLVRDRAEYAEHLHALGHAYVLARRKPDAQRTARKLEALDRGLAAKLNAEIAGKP